MFKTALLVVTKPLNQLRGHIPAYLSEVNRLASESAYIHIQPGAFKTENNSSQFELFHVPLTTEVRNIIKDFYTSSSRSCNRLDVRVLVGHFTSADLTLEKYNFRQECDIVLIDQDLVGDGNTELRKWFNVKEGVSVQKIDISEHSEEDDNAKRRKTNLDDQAPERVELLRQYPHVVLGGTLDRLHVGHKLLLSEGCCLATNKLTCGVTDGEMNNKKTLPELLEPIETRISIAKHFMEEVKPSLQYIVVPITDGAGPTIREPDMDLIVLSEETKKGGAMINAEREKKGMKPLLDYTIELVEDTCHSDFEETKVSSSSLRKRLLGTLYHPLKTKTDIEERPYVIGLTGGIASGKSSVCKRLEGLGGKIVDCDKLGHRAYVKGSPGFEKVVSAFGADIIGTDGEVDRKALGKLVFSNKEELERLNELVWPEIARMAQEQIQEYAQDDAQTVVLDAAILLEAGWDSMCHEVWTTIVPKHEAISRIVERNKITEEQAGQRVSSQISNTDRVNQSNVILCTLWEYEYTQEQVEKAWGLLQQRLTAALDTGSTKTKSNM